jgi:hypothetical protein
VSTFRLEPEHFILTTGTFNLIVKDRIAFRLSGALSVRTDPLRESMRPRNLSTVSRRAITVNPLQSQDFHLFCTMGSCPPGEKNSSAENSLRQRDDALPLAMAGLIRRMPKRKTVRSKKIAGRFCFSRNPSGTLFPNANPETRGQIGGFLYSMSERLIRFRQTQTPRQSSSDLKFIAEA